MRFNIISITTESIQCSSQVDHTAVFAIGSDTLEVLLYKVDHEHDQTTIVVKHISN